MQSVVCTRVKHTANGVMMNEYGFGGFQENGTCLDYIVPRVKVVVGGGG